MKNVGRGVVCALVFASSVAGFAQSGSTVVEQARAVQSAPVTGTLKGVIKKIDDASIVLTPSNNKNAEVTLQLTAATKRSGAVATGDAVTVTFHFENGARVVTSVTGKANGK
jgi:hypothetical protein